MPRSSRRKGSSQVGRGGYATPILQLAAAALPVTACSTAPAQDLVGSYFPAWMLCAAGGVVAAVIIRLILVAAGISEYVVAPPLTYTAIAASATFGFWLTWYGH